MKLPSLLALALASLAPAMWIATAHGAAADPPFALVQPELHDLPNTFANAWGDYDDGDLDLSVMSYEGPPGAQQPKDALFRNDGPAGFVDVIDAGSPLNRGDHSAQLVDVDGDGGPDLAITDGYGPAGGTFLFHNTLPDTAKRRSLAVQVVDARGHATRFGAEVRLFDRSGAIIASQLVLTSGGYNTQRVAPLHVGLENLSPVTVEVTFMGRNGRTTQRFTSVRPADYYRKTLLVREVRPLTR